MHRRYIYASSLIGVGVLLDELAYFIASRRPLHLADRGVRVFNRVRDAARF